MLEKKLKILEKKSALELQKAQEFSKQKNKRGEFFGRSRENDDEPLQLRLISSD